MNQTIAILFFLLFLLPLPHFTFGQMPGEMLAILDELLQNRDKTGIDNPGLELRLGDLLLEMKQNNQDAAEMVENYLKNKTDSEIVFVYNTLSNSINLIDQEMSLFFLNKTLGHVDSGDFKTLAKLYTNIGASYYNMALDSYALTNYLKSLNYLKNINGKEEEEVLLIRASVLANISIIYLRQGNKSLAKQYNEEMFSIMNEYPADNKFLTTKILGLYTSAKIASSEKKDSLGESYLKEALAISLQIKNLVLECEVLRLLGDNTNDLITRLYYHEKAYNTLKNLENPTSSSLDNMFSLVETYLQLYENEKYRNELIPPQSKDFYLKKAKSLLNLYNEYIESKGAIQTKMRLYQSYSRLKWLEGDYKNAFDYSEKYHQLNDSIFSQENKNKLAALESQSALELKDKEIKIKELTLNQKEKQTWYLAIGLLLASVIGILLFYQNRLRKKKNEELDEANRIKTQFFSILNHDLRSPVGDLVHYLYLRQENPEVLDEEIRNKLDAKTMESAKNLLVSMEDLLLWSKGQMENFKPQPENILIENIFNDLSRFFSGKENITVLFENPQNLELFTDENYLKTIMRNLTSNAVKALENTENAKITWRAYQENGKNILSITDNGPGGTDAQFRALYDEKEVVGIKTGLGLHLVRDMAKAIGCNVKVNTTIGKGTVISLVFGK